MCDSNFTSALLLRIYNANLVTTLQSCSALRSREPFQKIMPKMKLVAAAGKPDVVRRL